MSTKITPSDLSVESFLLQEGETDEIIIPFMGKDTKWEYRKLSWYEKNKAVTKATTLNQDENGEMTFGFDVAVYYSECLQRMIVAAPLPITPTTLRALRPEVGERLQELVPPPMGSVEVADQAKKESEKSSEAEE